MDYKTTGMSLDTVEVCFIILQLIDFIDFRSVEVTLVNSTFSLVSDTVVVKFYKGMKSGFYKLLGDSISTSFPFLGTEF